jgi:peptide/nickel transport system ATP-binding protein
MDPDRRSTEPPLSGDPPNPINPPSGCRFRPRCAFAEEICAHSSPKLEASPRLDPIGGDHEVACHMMVPGSGHSRASASADGLRSREALSALQAGEGGARAEGVGR